MNKQEILEAISTIEINCWDFEHEYDSYQRGYAKTTKTIENENFTLVLEIEEEVRWERDGSSFEPVNKSIAGLIVTDENGKEIEANITDKEILQTLGL
ncbi:MAG: hypothetical protein WAW57_15350 [Lutibacter sp.]